MPKTAPPVRIDVVSDVICPWCYIGKRHLEAAIGSRPDVAVEVRWRPFQLNPDMPREGMSRADYLLAKFGDPSGGGIYDRVIAAGHMAGIEFEFEKIGRTPNTVAAHRLIAFADEDGRQDAVVEALFQAYFLHGRDLSDPDELAAIGGEAGLSEHTLTRFRTTDACEAEVRAEDSIARQTGVNGVPCFIFDRAFAISGAHPPEVLASAIDEALSERVAAAE
jgi:predicted DsbA family dithiol-disulfide isomerase